MRQEKRAVGMGTGGAVLNQMKRCEAKSVSPSRARLPGYRLASLKHEKTDIDRREGEDKLQQLSLQRID